MGGVENEAVSPPKFDRDRPLAPFWFLFGRSKRNSPPALRPQARFGAQPPHSGGSWRGDAAKSPCKKGKSNTSGEAAPYKSASEESREKRAAPIKKKKHH